MITITSTKITVTPVDPNAGEDEVEAPAMASLAKGDPAEPLGDWAGTQYSFTSADTGISDEAIVFTNKGAARSKPFAEGATFTANLPADATAVQKEEAFEMAYSAASRMLTLGTRATPTKDIAGDGFPTAGTTTYTSDVVNRSVVIDGTYQGASGKYSCTGECVATGAAGAVSLTGSWIFVHDEGATTSKADTKYLYYGWWLRKSAAGSPTDASAFFGTVGVAASTDATMIGGTATYAGHAAGKFAINDPIGPADAGHFTADVELKATFGPNSPATPTGTPGGVSGMVTNFMANEQAVPWSVRLRRAGWDTDQTGSPGAYSIATDGTVWSIDDKESAMSGSWSGQMYDEKPGNAPAGDGSSVPTSTGGVFQSNFGSTRSMIGAFGATKE